MRTATVTRTTLETDIALTLTLEGTGASTIATGVGFLDHMLTALARYARFDLTLTCTGDLDVDAHHTVEDVGLCLGDAIAQAVGTKRGIARVAHAHVPMDEAIAFVAVDLSGRAYLAYRAQLAPAMLGAFDPALAKEFFRALATRAALTLHIAIDGENAHHMLEAAFKALGRALRDAVAIDAREDGVLSTKGTLE